MNIQPCAINKWFIDRPSGSIQHIVTGERRRLGAYQLKLFDIFQQNPGKIFTREELTNLIWQRRVVGSNSLPNIIHTLRVALEDDGKQQRIIRTLPKQGYMLDATYCQPLLQPEPHGEADTAAFPPPSLPMPQGKEGLSPGKMAMFALAMVFSMVCTWYLAVSRSNIAVPKEMAKNVYRHLRIFTLLEPGETLKEQTAIVDRLTESYGLLNQELHKKSLRMSIYYHSENQILNYTLRLHNTCEQKVLIMQIDHWRADTALLNKLILSETRRKIDEMAPCNTQ
ncbi:winged helix-turn-helix domain-containing protein [Kosakonia sp. H02]|nr:winged helix-turn-helix domain-containing protein [Kosakonia sp. H02]